MVLKVFSASTRVLSKPRDGYTTPILAKPLSRRKIKAPTRGLALKCAPRQQGLHEEGKAGISGRLFFVHLMFLRCVDERAVVAVQDK